MFIVIPNSTSPLLATAIEVDLVWCAEDEAIWMGSKRHFFCPSITDMRESLGAKTHLHRQVHSICLWIPPICAAVPLPFVKQWIKNGLPGSTIRGQTTGFVPRNLVILRFFFQQIQFILHPPPPQIVIL